MLSFSCFSRITSFAKAISSASTSSSASLELALLGNTSRASPSGLCGSGGLEGGCKDVPLGLTGGVDIVAVSVGTTWLQVVGEMDQDRRGKRLVGCEGVFW